MNKLLTFIVPTYNAEKYLEENLNIWKKISSVVEVIIIEDGKDEKAKKISKIINAKYFSKKNGNWGSVINFAKRKHLVKTKYMAIVDPDDIIIMNDLLLLIEDMKKDNKDIIFTNYVNADYLTGKEKTMKTRNPHFIHQMWFKSEIFYSTTNLPENVPFMDWILVVNLMHNSKSTRYIDIAPYKYFLNIVGQTATIDEHFYLNKVVVQAIRHIENLEKIIDNFDKKLVPSYLLKSSRNRYVYYLRLSYDQTISKDTIKYLTSLYKMERKEKYIYISKRLFWSKLYRIFAKKK